MRSSAKQTKGGNTPLLLDAEDIVNTFFVNVRSMSNADYDIQCILNEYIGYHISGTAALDHYHRYGYSHTDREDGEILLNGILTMFHQLDAILGDLMGTIVKVALSDDQKTLLVVIEYAK